MSMSLDENVLAVNVAGDSLRFFDVKKIAAAVKGTSPGTVPTPLKSPLACEIATLNRDIDARSQVYWIRNACIVISSKEAKLFDTTGIWEGKLREGLALPGVTTLDVFPFDDALV